MNKNCLSFFIIATFVVFFLFAFFTAASAEVMIYDTVTSSNKSIKLKALTKGRFFPEGGKLVEFYINEKHIGTTLSGGDGYAFLRYLPPSPGIEKLSVRAGDDNDEGSLLVTGKNRKVVMIAVEGILSESILSFKPSKEAKKALQQISKNYSIVYLTTLLGVKGSRQWLKDNNFPLSAILKWQGAELLDNLQDRGVNLYAIIGSPDLLSEAAAIKKRFSFQETEEGITVKDWDDLLKRIEGKNTK